MRAQRAFRDFGIARAERPLIRRANIVIAEPMPGEADLRADFLARLADPALAAHFENLVDRMKLAGELGLLLRVEELVQMTAPKGENLKLFAPPAVRLRSALARFADEAAIQQARRRLFRDDAVQGLGLVEIAEKRFEVVLMNPPFGAGGAGAKKYFDLAYPKSRNDIYAALVERGIELLCPRGQLGAITSRTGFFLSSFQKWREEILLERALPTVFADLGFGVLDSAMVETAAFCLEARP